MKYLLTLLIMLYGLNSFSQGSIEVPEKPIIDNSLAIKSYDSNPIKYNDSPTYIVNDGYAIYEDIKKRIFLTIDKESFQRPKRNFRPEFALDKNGIYCKGHLIVTDTTGFTSVGKDELLFWKTKTKVFKDTIEVREIDAESFKSVGGNYYIDKDYVYYLDKRIEGSDPGSFSYGNLGFYDKNNVYKNEEIVYHNGEHLQPVNSMLAKTSKEIIANPNYQEIKPEELKAMDVATLKPLSRRLSRDKNNIYYHTTPIFKKLKKSRKIKVWDQENSIYITDDKHIYDRHGYKYSGVDLQTFGILPNSNFVYDKNGVYIVLSVGNEPYNFKKLPFNYDEPVSINNTFAYSHNCVIYKNQACFKETEKLYPNLTDEQVETAKKNGSLCLSTPSECNKFFFHSSLYKNTDGVWANNEKTNVDATTFERVGYGNSYKDKNNVYYFYGERGLIILEGADAPSAKPFNNFLRDKNYIYWGNIQLISSEEIELQAIFKGYRAGCGQDTRRGSNFYLFKNKEGYWLTEISSNEATLRFLGKTPTNDWYNTSLPEDFVYR